MKIIIVLLGAVVFAGFHLYAQDTPDKIVSVSLSPPAVLSPGNEAVFEIHVKIKKGWHINSDKPLDKNLVATELTLNESPAFKLSSVAYPKPVMITLPFSENVLSLFEREIVIKVKGTAAKNIKSAKVILEGELRFQPCNDNTCLFPSTKKFQFEVAVR